MAVSFSSSSFPLLFAKFYNSKSVSLRFSILGTLLQVLGGFSTALSHFLNHVFREKYLKAMQPAVYSDFTQYFRGFKLFPTRSFLTKIYFDNEKKYTIFSPLTARLCLPMLPLETWTAIGKTVLKLF